MHTLFFERFFANTFHGPSDTVFKASAKLRDNVGFTRLRLLRDWVEANVNWRLAFPPRPAATYFPSRLSA